MSGKLCSDFSAAFRNENELCLKPRWDSYSGLITYWDGRVAEIDEIKTSAWPGNVDLKVRLSTTPTLRLSTHSSTASKNKMTDLLLITAGEHKDLIVYTDGRVAEIHPTAKPSSSDELIFRGPDGNGEIKLENVEFYMIEKNKTAQCKKIDLTEPTTTTETIYENLIFINQAMQGTEIGDCFDHGRNISLPLLPTTYKGVPISWGPEHLREIYRLMGQERGESGNAFFCSNQEDVYRIAVNNGAAHRARLLAAIKTLESGDQGSLDNLHAEALLVSLQTAAVISSSPPEVQSHFSKYFLTGVSLLTGYALVDKFRGRMGGGGNDGGPGGASPGSDSKTATTTNGVASEPPTSDDSSSFTANKGFWGGLAAACFVGVGVLLADDLTGVGVADDPLAVPVGVAGLAFLGIAALSGDKTTSKEIL